MMLAIPARVAGVAQLTVVTPPRRGGGLDPAIALAAEQCGIDAIWTVGGAQAIAALAFGAGDIPAVDRIAGPGNAWVAAAKALVASLPGGPGIDLPAGPSELMVIADASADPATVAADLLSQAEHDPSAQVILVTPDAALIDAIEREWDAQAAAMAGAFAPARAILVADLDQAVAIANAYAPEHLSLATDQAETLVARDHQRRGDLRRAPRRRDLRRLSRRVEPRPADRRRGALHRRRLDADLHEGDHRPARVARRARALPPPPPPRSPASKDSKPTPAPRSAAHEPRRPPRPPRNPRARAVRHCRRAAPGTVRLDANENPFASLVAGQAGINRYPEPQPQALRQRLADLYGVAPASLWVARGSDDAIDLLIRAFCRPGVDSVAIVEPTFSAYAQFARVQGATVISRELTDDFVFDADAVLATIGDKAPKLLFLCTPNNPTGTAVDPADVRRIAAVLRDTLVVVDEAYGEFSAAQSFAGKALGNVVVLRTLSKAYGLAGARIGCAIADPEIIALLAKVAPPYPLPTPSIAAALDALGPERMPIHAERIERLLADRDTLAGQLTNVAEIERIRTGGNFLFLEVADPAGLARRLAAAAVRVRFRPNAAPGGVRVTIGTEAENRALLAVFGIASYRTIAPRGDHPRHQGNAHRARHRSRPRRSAADRQRHPLLRPHARPSRGAWRLQPDPRLHRRP